MNQRYMFICLTVVMHISARPLHHAVRAGMCRSVVGYKARGLATSCHDYLQAALTHIKAGDLEKTEQTLQHTPEHIQQQYVYAAAAYNQPEMLSMLISRGLSPSMANTFGHTPLMKAAACQSFYAARYLLQKREVQQTINVQATNGMTALAYLAQQATHKNDTTHATDIAHALIETDAAPTIAGIGLLARQCYKNTRRQLNPLDIAVITQQPALFDICATSRFASKEIIRRAQQLEDADIQPVDFDTCNAEELLEIATLIYTDHPWYVHNMVRR